MLGIFYPIIFYHFLFSSLFLKLILNMAHLKCCILWLARFSTQKKIKFSLYSFHVIHDYLTIRRQTRGFYLLIVDKGRRPKSTIKVNRAPINDTGARVIKTITSCEIAIQMMPILGIQTSLLHLVFYSIFEHFVIFLLCIIKCVNHEKRLQI